MSGRGWVVFGVGGFWMMIGGLLIRDLTLIGGALAIMLVASLAIVLKEWGR